ncbi:phytanoyl-CoA dioxygenase family protein [Ascoidea rubescens DSM 1968]|uniref:Phytanoyl-CoA dioxygenase domain-containing protein 1 n=1 Tax=Ascoidea rubescens DSM 1968 TaxID=1344418 RepID=A0A1D2V8L3_9ASCO|nr:phytanoyl-CoA dioxygenase domain-containing protein 1 [Ascoidea rubescens DSM 1968]ODV57835.1 phytanoyl-CoA dioxygenase domain-containing protein 1 [Ascoidea rubescens DSM 1968]
MISYENGLTIKQLNEFDKEGCLCLPNFLSAEQVEELLCHSKELLNDMDLSNHPMTKFTTGETLNEKHIGDEYFLESSDKISYFFEPDAFNKEGELIKAKEKSINKIGHSLHTKDEKFNKITMKDSRIQKIARQLKFVDPRVLQSMLIFKQPEIGAKVPSHQDGVFLYTKPLSAIGFWFALENCSQKNGCLSYNPGSHKTFPIKKRFVKVDKGRSGCNIVSINEIENRKEGKEDEDEEEIKDKDMDEDYKFVECKAGSLILIHNSVLHKSEPNLSEESRYAYTFHVIDCNCEYDELNWLQVPPSEDGGTDFAKLY